MSISDVVFTAATREAAKTGLLGWVTFVLSGSLRIDGVTVRRTLSGHLALTFPQRTDRQGNAHPYICPLDNATRIEIVRQVLAALPGDDLGPAS